MFAPCPTLLVQYPVRKVAVPSGRPLSHNDSSLCEGLSQDSLVSFLARLCVSGLSKKFKLKIHWISEVSTVDFKLGLVQESWELSMLDSFKGIDFQALKFRITHA